MKHIFPAILLIASALASAACGQSSAPAPILPDSLRWTNPPQLPGVQVAWIVGGEQKVGAYLLRVKLASGARIPPHTHPDERNTTVLAGTIYVGFGETFDEAKAVAIPAGAVYVAPANVPHYVWAKEGEARYQEAGAGPTGSAFLKK